MWCLFFSASLVLRVVNKLRDAFSIFTHLSTCTGLWPKFVLEPPLLIMSPNTVPKFVKSKAHGQFFVRFHRFYPLHTERFQTTTTLFSHRKRNLMRKNLGSLIHKWPKLAVAFSTNLIKVVLIFYLVQLFMDMKIRQKHFCLRENTVGTYQSKFGSYNPLESLYL